MIYKRYIYILSILNPYVAHMKLIKKTLLFFIVIIIIATLSIWAITRFVSPITVNTLLNKQLSALKIQPSQLDGTIVWRFFPRPGIKISHIHIGEKNTASIYTLYIDKMLFNLQITPLLGGHLVFNELELEGVRVNIDYNSKPIDTKELPHPTTKQTTNHPKQLPITFAINSFLLTHGKIIVQQAENTIIISNLQLGAKNPNFENNYFPLQFKANLAATIANNKLKTMLDYKGKIRLNPSLFDSPSIDIHQLSTDGQLLLQQVRLNRIKILKIATHVKTKPSEIIFNPLNVVAYNGESVGDLSYHFGLKKLSINQTANGLDASQFLMDLFGNNWVKGNLDFSLHATSNQQHLDWKNNLRGNGSFTIKEGQLSLIDMDAMIVETVNKFYALLNQYEEAPKPQADSLSITPIKGSTTFQLLSVQYRLQDAQLINDSVLLQTDKSQIKGHGLQNLNDNKITASLTAKLRAPEGNKINVQQLLGGSIPFNITGFLPNPHIVFDLKPLQPIISNYLSKQKLKKPEPHIKQHSNNPLAAPLQ